MKSFNGQLARYSQPFMQGARQLDPDKLSKVMFLTGMAIGACGKGVSSVEGGTAELLSNTLDTVDQKMEATVSDEQRIQSMYDHYTSLVNRLAPK